MGLKLGALREYLRTSLWFAPTLCVLVAGALALLTIDIDRDTADGGVLAFTGSAEAARGVLTTIATSIATLAALVFSVTIVVLQLASSQYSPRVLRSFLRDRRSQLTLGVFLGTFAYAMLVLRSVRTNPNVAAEFVPELSVHVAYGLAGLSLLFFVIYIHYLAESMQASSIVGDVVAETRAAMERLYPTIGEDLPAPAAATRRDGAEATVSCGRSGYLQELDEERAFELATAWDVTVRLVPRIGDFVADRAPLFRVAGPVDDDRVEALRGIVTIGRRRSMRQDPGFGFRQLVDIAEKAMSPGINDPTTAVEAIDRLHELLLALADRRIPSPERVDEAGVVRLVLPRPSWESYVRLALDEIRQYGVGSIQVTRRLRSAVEGLLDAAPPSRRPPLEVQLRLLDRSAERGFPDLVDVVHAKEPSAHG